MAECPTLPGCISQGATRQEALTHIQDAIGGYLASLKKHGEPAPLPKHGVFSRVNAWVKAVDDASLTVAPRDHANAS